MTIEPRNVTIQGRAVDRQKEGVAGLRVEVWDSEFICGDAVGASLTDAQGAFQIDLDEAHLARLFPDRDPDLYFKVLQNGGVRRSNGDEVLWNLKSGPAEVLLEVGSGEERSLEVKGAVRFAGGLPAAAFLVSAFDRDLRSEQKLGTARTDKDGLYRIHYFAGQFRTLELAAADLVVKAFDTAGSELAASPILFNAPSPAEVDLTIPAAVREPPALFERIQRALPPLLGELQVKDLREDGEYRDLSFLAGEAGFETRDVARFALAHHLAQDELPAVFWFALLGGPVYEFGAEQSVKLQLETVLKRLPALDAAAARKALTRALNVGEISEAFRPDFPQWVDAFLKYSAGLLVGDSDAPSFVRLALADAGITDAGRQERFARLFIEHKSLTRELLAALAQDASFKRGEVEHLRTSFELADLTRGDFSVVAAIKTEFNVRRPSELPALARKSAGEWVEFVKTKQAARQMNVPLEFAAAAGAGRPQEAEIYGRHLEQKFREAFPTASFAGGLERALNNGGPRGLRRAEELREFLDNHPDFELLNTPVDEYLRKQRRRPPRARAAAAGDDFARELKAVQRVFKLAPSFEAADELLADDIHSAQKAYRMGKTEFVRRYSKRNGFTEQSARQAWNRAADTHAAAVTIVADLKALEANGLPQALLNGNEALKTFPNWDSLFQTGDLCECEHCRSVLGPAAYFADLLMFLKDRQAVEPGASVKDVLFARRPDLGYLELNCENALTPLPYIDVMCEVLEHAVAPEGNELELAGLAAIPDDGEATRAQIVAALDAHGVSLGASFSLSQVDPPDVGRWVAHGDDATYLLRNDGAPNFTAEILRNTKTNAGELRAYPQYVNAPAYAELRQSRYPMTLPFDLFAEEVRAAMQKTNLQRWDLMGALRGNAAPNDPTEGDVAAEYFRISTDAAAPFDERQLILAADATDGGQQAVWGETGPAWLEQAGNVKSFLAKTNLEYNELLALLDLKFINPDGDIAVSHQDASCDTEKKVIELLDATKLDRLHRFLRLWRKLDGWKMWELDLVILHPQIGNGVLDEPFLINLFHFGRLRNRLGKKASVEQACALLGDLNTETRFTKLHEKRQDALYQSLFLNRRLIQPLDPAFNVAEVAVPGPTVEKLAGHRAVVMAVLGAREADLVLLETLARVSDGLPYITDDLTLTNLSFLWRHAWLSKQLKLKTADWVVLLKLMQQDLMTFDSPQAAWEFVQRVDALKATGFTPDELNWLLAADRSAKAAAKESDAARFLTSLRKELQEIQAEHDPAQYDFLNAVPPSDEPELSALLTTLLQKLGREEAEVLAFLSILKGGVSLEAPVEGLPAGFAFPPSITAAPNHLPVEYDETNSRLRFAGLMQQAQSDILLTDSALAAVADISAYRNAVEELFQLSQAAFTNYARSEIGAALPGGLVLPSDRPSLPIRYNPATEKLTFVGVMTEAERLALIAAGNPADAIDELFRLPRLAIKFFEPVFVEPLGELPAAVNFKDQLPAELAAKIEYDAEGRRLRFSGIMNSNERDALHALVPNVLPEEVAYHDAVNGLAAQPQTIAPPDARVWLTDADLDASLPANDTLAERLANAVTKALGYLSKTLAAGEVVQQSGAQLGLTEAQARLLLSRYEVLPVPPAPPNSTLLEYLTTDFAETTGVVDYATLKPAFDGWFWAGRVSALVRKWKTTLEEWERLLALNGPAQLLDFLTLPLDALGAPAPIDRFLRTARLLRLRESLPENGVTLLEVLEKLSAGAYPAAADFAADVELLNEAWPAADVAALIASLDLAYPDDYLLAESWERVRRAFYFLGNLNAGPDTVSAFAAAAMGPQHARTLKELLRSKFGTETWLTLSAEIQDSLRERKRDALSAYLLTRDKPDDAPSARWESPNDLYAYYLLDVEMCSCQLTSRLVQASGSVQLFVQRCFMGLEPGVEVKAGGVDGDSAWRWWKWMRKYRVWEANRKVFLWPENWIEPELRRDKSQFFKDLEDELLQNEIDEFTAETALQNYLEKLDGVAQLEVAGFYHEDDGDNAILHVFGRTRGAEPHLYFYRRYDYRQWTPWEKVELDIEGDFLIPVVVNRRLFLFWPIFKEVADQNYNNVTVPQMSLTQSQSITVAKTQKRLRMNLAVSGFRQGKWTPKKVSKDFAQSNAYSTELVSKLHRFYAVDRGEIDGRFGIMFDGYSRDHDGDLVAYMSGAFEIANCKGVPEFSSFGDNLFPALRPESAATGDHPLHLKWAEIGPVLQRLDAPENDFTLRAFGAQQGQLQTPVLIETPQLFRMTPPWHLSYFDKLLLDAAQLTPLAIFVPNQVPFGTWLPFFYHDLKRTFFVLPSLKLGRTTQGEREGEGVGMAVAGGIRHYYPEIKKVIRQLEDLIGDIVQSAVDAIDLDAMPAAQREQLEAMLKQELDDERFPPYADGQVREMMKRYLMRFAHKFLGEMALSLFQFRQFHFKNFYHPFVCDFARLVHNPLRGIPALMSRENQLRDSGFRFKQHYQPTFWVVEPPTESFHPREVVDFTPDGAYSPYNWELFFHAPLLIANSLSRNQRFEEAREWYHFIFNPLGVDGPVPGGSVMSRYWITKPFFETTDPQYIQQRIENVMLMLAGDTSVPGYSAEAKKSLEDQVLDWRINPFEPHRIANYRTVAYQKTVVMKYLDNLVAWGDYLFRQDSMESINEATQLYVLAAEILGPRPTKVPPQARPPLESFNELEKELDAFSNALVEVENLLPPLSGDNSGDADPAPIPTLYFCIPHNEKMLAYWDTVADRLYKIRHCMNIEGVVRQLALFEPPIDPAALVKAVAGGLDIGSALADLNTPLPLYRFNVMLQKAKEVCNDVRALGGALLAALEKKDAEALLLLRQGQEMKMLEAVKAVREQQLEEQKENLEALKRSKATVEVRRDYYRDIEKVSAGEQLNLDKLESAQRHQLSAQNISIGASVLGYIPNATIGGSGWGGSPHVNVQFGTGNIISALQAAAGSETQLASIDSYEAGRAATSAAHDRRFDDWKLQERLADREIAQIEQQLTAAELRIGIAEKELDNHALQIENARATDQFMRAKYTNVELYQWQVGQISGTFFQSYRLAYDLAKRAERCFRFELGLQDSSYVNFGYWDSLKKGLLSGEKLLYDLHRMESAFLERNRRELELTKHVSLVLLDPLALVKLRETGRCFFRLPEESFDLDFPGHYFRRIKSVSLTLPCVAGPYTTVSCTLRLLKNSVRINTTNGEDGYPHNVDDEGLPADDTRFIENNIPLRAIAASHAQNDSGMFEFNFRDDRYLPFEGAGAVSEWSLELFSDLPANNPEPANPDFGRELRQFDYGTIADAILHVKYTAREDAGAFKNGAINHLRAYFREEGTSPSLRLLDLRREFPGEWHRFLNPANPANGNVLEIEMSPALFPLKDADKTLKVNRIWVLARCSDPGVYEVVLTPPLPAPVPPDPPGANTLPLAKVNQYGGLHFGQKDVAAFDILVAPAQPPVKWQVKMTRPGGGNLGDNPDTNTPEVEDLMLVLGYEW